MLPVFLSSGASAGCGEPRRRFSGEDRGSISGRGGMIMRKQVRGLGREFIRKLASWPEFLGKMNGWAVAAMMIAIATVSSYLFFTHMKNPASNIALVYVLAVFITARSTDRYRYGQAAALAAVFLVNYLYTYPFRQLNFTMTGYPLTFVVMFSISSITSTLTTGMKEQAQELQESEKRLMEAEKERMRANLLRAISHDLRTPLTSIIGSSTLYLEAGDGMDEGKKRQLVSHILEDSNWLLNMVENLLSVTRINNETAGVRKTEEPVEEVIGAAVSRLRKRIPDAKIRVRVPEELIMLPMDAILIEQVLINLLENAVVHSGSSEPVDCYADEDERQVNFYVRDYGRGIEPERISTIFDGSAAPSQGADGHKGMGIGLSICKTIIVAHSGEIGVRNANPGAVFWFSLPKGGEESGPGKKPADKGTGLGQAAGS
jgi:two-component system sensor histidine kinase KdpD